MSDPNLPATKEAAQGESGPDNCQIARLERTVGGMREVLNEASNALAVFALMASAWDGLDAEHIVAEVRQQHIRVSSFRDAREFYFGELRAALAASSPDHAGAPEGE